MEMMTEHEVEWAIVAVRRTQLALLASPFRSRSAAYVEPAAPTLLGQRCLRWPTVYRGFSSVPARRRYG